MMRLINKMPECRFVLPATKMQETRNKMPAGERLLIRKSALSAIFSYRLDKLIETDKRHHETRI